MKDDRTIYTDQCEEKLLRLYGKQSLHEAQSRYKRIEERFCRLFGDRRVLHFYSAPGRTEIGGNHTDHQHGCVLAAAIHLDVVAAVAEREDGIIRFYSEGFDPMEIDTADTRFHQQETGSSEALLRGICAKMKQLGYRIGGFDAYCSSKVPIGSGLSSSAAYEILMTTIESHLYNQGKVDAQTAAMIAQFAENQYFGKPCGLMDQMACSVGGVVAMDFQDAAHPIVQKIEYNPDTTGFTLCVVETGGDHSGLTEEYARISQEMQAVAQQLGVTVLRECKEDRFYQQLPQLRERLGDRAVLRAIHFFEENKRAVLEKEALLENNFEQFRHYAVQSGHSSFEYLQNVYSHSRPHNQELAVALALSQTLLEDKGGVWRVHGGGFAGAIQAFVPVDFWDEYKTRMEAAFGEGCCQPLRILSLIHI